VPDMRAVGAGRAAECHRAEEILAGDIGQISAGEAQGGEG